MSYINVVKIIIALIAIQDFIFLFAINDKSARLLVRTKAPNHLWIIVVKLTFTYYVWFYVHSYDITLLNCFYFSTALRV